MTAPASMSVLFLPLSAQLEDPETIAWSRAVPLLVAEGFSQITGIPSTFAIWTTGQGPAMRLCHLQVPAPVENVAAYGRAAGAALAFTGLASWHGDAFVRWDLVATDGRGHLARSPVSVDDPGRRSSVARAAWEAALGVLGVEKARLPSGLQTESDDAMISFARDREAVWTRRRRGLSVDRIGYRYLLSSLTCDPSYEAPVREIFRRAGDSLVATTGGWDQGRPMRAAAREALEAAVRLRRRDHVAWTLLGMLQRADERLNAAREALQKATAIQPDYAPAHREMGSVLLDLGQLRKAGAHLRKAGALAPRDPEVHLYLGGLYVATSQRRNATDHLRAVLKLAAGTGAAGQAARLLRDIDEGPVRTVTNPLAGRGDRRAREEHHRSRDRALIARTFDFAEVVPTRMADVSLEIDETSDLDVTFTD